MTIADIVVSPALGVSLAGISLIVGFVVTYNKHNKDKIAEGVEKGKFEQFVLGKIEDIIKNQEVGVEFDKEQERINAKVANELLIIQRDIEDYIKNSHRKDGE